MSHSTVFADASFYIALLSKADANHGRAIAWEAFLRQRSAPVLTTEAVLWECLDFYRTPRTRRLIHRAILNTIADPLVEIIRFDQRLCDSALALCATADDKGWSMEDCFSFIVMRQHGLSAALSSDHHFEQAGFQPLLLHDPQ